MYFIWAKYPQGLYEQSIYKILYMNKTIIAICYAGISIASTVKVYMNGESIHIMSYAAGLFLGLAMIVAIMAYNDYEKKPIAETEEK